MGAVADMMIAAVADRNAATVLIGADHAPRTGTASAQHDLRGHSSTSLQFGKVTWSPPKRLRPEVWPHPRHPRRPVARDVVHV